MDEKKYVLRLSPELYAVIERRAKKRLRSVNNEMVMLLKLGLVSEMNENQAMDQVDQLLVPKSIPPKIS